MEISGLSKFKEVDLEDIEPGNCFIHADKVYVLTSKGSKLVHDKHIYTTVHLFTGDITEIHGLVQVLPTKAKVVIEWNYYYKK